MNACGFKKDFILANNGTSSYKIVLSKEASLSEKHAAKELQHFIHMATKTTLPIVDENESAAKEPLRIFVGNRRAFKKVFFQQIRNWNNLNGKKLGDEGFILRTIPTGAATPDVVIAGGRQRGTMYGVYTFLEHIGFRWYTNRKTWYPEKEILRVPQLDEKENTSIRISLPLTSMRRLTLIGVPATA